MGSVHGAHQCREAYNRSCYRDAWSRIPQLNVSEQLKECIREQRRELRSWEQIHMTMSSLIEETRVKPDPNGFTISKG